MRIVIDLQGAQTASTFRGIGRYTKSFALAMARNAGEHEIWLVLNAAFPNSILEIRQLFSGLIPEERIRIFDIPIVTAEHHCQHLWGVRAAEKIREFFIHQLKPDLLLITSLFEGYGDNAITSIGAFTNIKTAVILYDLIPFLNPAAYLHTASREKFYNGKISSLKKADLMLAISNYSRQSAIKTLGLPPERVVTISTAAEGIFHPKNLSTQMIETIRHRYGISRAIVLYVGGHDARKNVDGLITAYALLPKEVRQDHQLVMAGKIDPLERARTEKICREHKLEAGEVILTDYISNDDLIALYNISTLVVFPSKDEGFGLPVLEAMACGAAVIGSDAASVPEVLGYPEALFDPSDPHSISAKIQQVLQNTVFRDQLCKHGILQAKKFSWDESARCAIRAIETYLTPQNTDKDFLHLAQTQNAIIDKSSLIRAIANLGQPPDHNLLTQTSKAIANTCLQLPQKQILIDVSYIRNYDSKIGIHRVVRSQLYALFRNQPEGYRIEPVYLVELNGVFHYRYAKEFTSKILNIPVDANSTLQDAPIDIYSGDIFYGLDFSPGSVMDAAKSGIWLHWRALGVKINMLVYDLLPIHRPEFFLKDSQKTHSTWLEEVTKFADRIIGISATVIQELRAWLEQRQFTHWDSLELCSIPLGANVVTCTPTMETTEAGDQLLTQFKNKMVFLMVGTIEPRKGHQQVLAAFEQLWREGHNISLVIVGKEGWAHSTPHEQMIIPQFIEKLRAHPERDKRLFWFENASDAYLQELYKSTSCLICASEGEGFGLPLIEAAYFKLPIITRDLPIFREVTQGHAYFFNGLTGEDLAESIKNWIRLYQNCQAPSSEGMKWYTWEQNVTELLSVLLSHESTFAAQVETVSECSIA